MIRELLFALVMLGTLGYFAFGVRMLIGPQTGQKQGYFDDVPAA